MKDVPGENAEVGFFSRLRWGPGSIATVVIVAVVAVLMILEGAASGDMVLEASGWILVVIDAIIVVVKGLERISPTRRQEDHLIGARGLVVMPITPSRPGVVRVGNELWSATSDEEIPSGAEVTVVAREGLYLRVRRADSRQQVKM